MSFSDNHQNLDHYVTFFRPLGTFCCSVTIRCPLRILDHQVYFNIPGQQAIFANPAAQGFFLLQTGLIQPLCIRPFIGTFCQTGPICTFCKSQTFRYPFPIPNQQIPFAYTGPLGSIGQSQSNKCLFQGILWLPYLFSTKQLINIISQVSEKLFFWGGMLRLLEPK